MKLYVSLLFLKCCSTTMCRGWCPDEKKTTGIFLSKAGEPLRLGPYGTLFILDDGCYTAGCSKPHQSYLLEQMQNFGSCQAFLNLAA